MSRLGWLPTLLAAAGDPAVKRKLLKGHAAGGMNYRVRRDGYNLVPHLTGQEPATFGIDQALEVLRNTAGSQ